MSASSSPATLRAARHAWILEALQRQSVLRISDLTDSLGAAAVTIRRDIAELAADGLVRRVRGGVTLPGSQPGGDAATPSGRSLGMLVPSLDYYWPDVAHGAEEAARELDMRLVLRGSSYDAEDDQPQLAHLVDSLNVDALIIAPRMDAPTTGHTIEWLAATGVPVVLVERTATAGPHHTVLESVVSDHALGAAMAVRHLVSLGHRRIGRSPPRSPRATQTTPPDPSGRPLKRTTARPVRSSPTPGARTCVLLAPTSSTWCGRRRVRLATDPTPVSVRWRSSVRS